MQFVFICLFVSVDVLISSFILIFIDSLDLKNLYSFIHLLNKSKTINWFIITNLVYINWILLLYSCYKRIPCKCLFISPCFIIWLPAEE